MAIYTESDLHTYSQNVTTVDGSLLTGSIDWRMDEVTTQHACPPFIRFSTGSASPLATRLRASSTGLACLRAVVEFGRADYIRGMIIGQLGVAVRLSRPPGSVFHPSRA